MVGKAFAMHVNARNSNHDPNHVLDRDPKRLSERDSFSCEHSQCKITREPKSCVRRDSGRILCWREVTI